MDLFGAGRKDETVAYPPLFIANGVTSTFPAGEMNPDAMRALRIRIDNGEVVGPRLMNSGPYFGTARPNWNREITRDRSTPRSTTGRRWESRASRRKASRRTN